MQTYGYCHCLLGSDVLNTIQLSKAENFKIIKIDITAILPF
jgi:hypothetical protein